jgi:hypothetical protein
MKEPWQEEMDGELERHRKAAAEAERRRAWSTSDHGNVRMACDTCKANEEKNREAQEVLEFEDRISHITLWGTERTPILRACATR